MASTRNQTIIAPDLLSYRLGQTHDTIKPGSKLGNAVLRFSYLLHLAGIEHSQDKAAQAGLALTLIPIGNRVLFYQALRSCLVSCVQDFETFAYCFRWFWQDHQAGSYSPDRISADHPADHPNMQKQPDHCPQRVQDAISAFLQDAKPDQAKFDRRSERQKCALLPSPARLLQYKDFRELSAPELRAASKAATALADRLTPRRLHRFKRTSRGRIDLCRMMRSFAQSDGDDPTIHYRSRKTTLPSLIIVCDVSSSMDPYTRIFLYFVHALTHHLPGCTSYLFATGLSDISAGMKIRDPDKAICCITNKARDWGGGTRIGPSIAALGRLYRNRPYPVQADLMLLSDGLERGGTEDLESALRLLKQRIRHLIWLNPLLRYDGYQSLAAGAAILARFSDMMLPVHNLASIQLLAERLGRL
ncbi:MAG: VWA domain-containing protein [Pseudomonadota bacterium]